MALSGLAVAAALVVWLRPPSGGDGTIKGHPSIAVTRAGANREKIHHARPGDRVALVVGSGKAGWLLVLAVDDASGGKAQVLWPAGGGAARR